MTQSLARETKERLLCSVSSKEPQECETETFLMITFNEMIQLAFQLSFDKTETQLMQLNCDLVRLKSLASTPTSSGKRVSHTQPREFKFLLSRVSQNFSRTSWIASILYPGGKKFTYNVWHTFQGNKDPILQIHEPGSLKWSAPFYRWKHQGTEQGEKMYPKVT